jgi:predicted amidophosphoribosyltransferase
MRRRNYDHGALLARYVARRLVRRQAYLQLTDRPAYRPSLVGAVCLLIDDVCTTTQTLRRNAKKLRQIGAAKVLALTVARTPANGYI